LRKLESKTPQTPRPKKAPASPAPAAVSNEIYPPEKIISALMSTKGMIAAAARMLGCDRGTIYDAAKRHPAIQDVIDGERELQLDMAEIALFTAISKGEGWAVCFYLKCQGRKRGYIEKAEAQLAGGMTLADLILGSYKLDDKNVAAERGSTPGPSRKAQGLSSDN